MTTERPRSPGAVWLQQRGKAWLWAAAFVIVVLAAIVLLFGIERETVVTGETSPLRPAADTPSET
jgi:hypothetical protein